MNDNKEICYPYAYGRLNASLDMLASNLEMACIREDIDVDDKVFEMLNKLVKERQTVAAVESFDKH
jgi:hypothetical protein